MQLTNLDNKVLNLLVEGAGNSEIAKELNVTPRTVKAHLNKLFRMFHIEGGIKRVKLAVLIYRGRLCKQTYTEIELQQFEKRLLSDSYQKDLRTKRSQNPLEQLNLW